MTVPYNSHTAANEAALRIVIKWGFQEEFFGFPAIGPSAPQVCRIYLGRFDEAPDRHATRTVVYAFGRNVIKKKRTTATCIHGVTLWY